jgi:hypothetical protein
MSPSPPRSQSAAFRTRRTPTFKGRIRRWADNLSDRFPNLSEKGQKRKRTAWNVRLGYPAGYQRHAVLGFDFAPPSQNLAGLEDNLFRSESQGAAG